MPGSHRKRLLYNGSFLLSLLVLLFNDHYWKYRYHNMLTGKLSDVAGLILLPLLLAYLFPRLRQYAVVPAGLFFLFWKLPLSEGFIGAYNQAALIPITRVVDYTDLWTLLVLPFVATLIGRIYRRPDTPQRLRRLPAAWVLIPCGFALMATSPPKSFYFSRVDGVQIGKSYKFGMSNEALLETLRREGYDVQLDSLYNSDYPWGLRNYCIRNVVLGMKDTIRLISFALEPTNKGKKTRLHLNKVVPANFDLNDTAAVKRYQGYYRELLRSEWVGRIEP